MIFKLQITENKIIEVTAKQLMQLKEKDKSYNAMIKKLLLKEYRTAYENLSKPTKDYDKLNLQQDKAKPPKNNFWKAYRRYKRQVWKITNTQPLHTLENYEKRGSFTYHVDHMVSVFYGFKNNIRPEVIGDISNLRIITFKENFQKGNKSIFNTKIC